MNRSVAVLVLALATALALGACFDKDTYVCAADTDCGTTGRCEPNHRCTVRDADCPSSRRYTDHSEALSNVCYEDNVDPLNPCASGQRPAKNEDACVVDVCAALPSCCTSGWVDACVQEAQMRCDLSCTTEIAITARATGIDELYTAHWTGTTWEAVAIEPREGASSTKLRYLAPAPGTLEPRLATLTTMLAGTGLLQIDNLPAIELSTRTYSGVASVDFDRNGTDTIALTSSEAPPGSVTIFHLEVRDLGSGESRDQINNVFSSEAVWGDYDHDAFPDAAFGAGVAYRAVVNRSQDGARVGVAIPDYRIAGSPGLRSLEWARIGGTENLDLVAGAGIMQFNLAPTGDGTLGTEPSGAYDCAKPPLRVTPGNGVSECTTMANPDVGWTAVARPSLATPAIVMSATNGSGTFQIESPPLASPAVVTLPIMGCASGTACPTRLLAFAVRDLDGDHTLDLIAIDSTLQIWTTSSQAPNTLRPVAQLPTAFTSVTNIDIAVTGVPR